MTISADNYFPAWRGDRKKEPRYLAVIDKDSCTSCNACATVCPVDCIYEVVSPRPAQSYHVIDTTRCIGCQLCYRIPSESSERYTLEVCPWNAIDMLHNPSKDGEPKLKDYYLGDQELAWGKLDEYGFQLSLNGEIRVPEAADDLQGLLALFSEPLWGRPDDRRRLTEPPRTQDGIVLYQTTEEGRQLLQFLFTDVSHLFLD